MYVQTLPVLLALLAGSVATQARRFTPLIDDEWTKKTQRTTECTFGKQIKELGSTWNADLGPPFGVMYCIKCECISVQKKRRIVARVQCRNIKNECPKLSCEEPVLLPGRCCKSCPGEYTAEIVQDLPAQQTIEEEERSLKHFGTLLSGRTSRQIVDRVNESSNGLVTFNYVATGRFTFHRKNLYFSFYLGSSTPRPKSLQFIDDNGSILEEQAIDAVGGIYQNATGKLCGVWRRVPRDYRKLLREEQLFVSLIWETPTATTPATAVLVGQLSRYKALSTEQFSSLLEPTQGVDRSLMFGSAATAIVSVSSASAPSIHVSLIFNGLFLPNDIADVPLTVVIEHQEKDYVLLHEEFTVNKPSSDLNFGEVRTAISGADLRLLSRGKLSITIASKKDPQALQLRGAITTRATCEIYQALLTSETSNSSGLAWAFLDRFGALRYGVKLVGLEEESPLVTLVDDGGKRKTELEDLTPALVGGSLANGSLDRPGPRLLEPLFKGELSVVAASSVGSRLRGRLAQRPVADAKDTSSPVLLRSPISGSTVGLIWLAVDMDCTLHYELELTGLPEADERLVNDDEDAKSRRLYLETIPLMAPGAPVSRRLLEKFDGNVLEGSISGLSLIELFRIDSGIGFLEVASVEKNVTKELVKSQFKTRAPLSCLPHYADNDVASVTVYGHQPLSFEIETASCFHETRFYEDGTQWRSGSDPCSMCHCHRGVAKCDPMPCPPLSCAAGRKVKAPAGHCCPLCLGSKSENSTSNTTSSPLISTTSGAAKSSEETSTLPPRGCTLAAQFHLAGAAWHPYLPPLGFDTCAICTCDPVNLEVRCPRVKCPPLDCDEKIAVRPDKKACCKQCPLVSVIPISGAAGQSSSGGSSLQDQAQGLQTREDPQQTIQAILADGGCKYPVAGAYKNGEDWHPKIHSHGEIKCVKCRCKNGEVKCSRKHCPKSLCIKLRHMSEPDDCCTAQCRRARRHHRHQRTHHQRHHLSAVESSPKPPKHSVTSRDLS